MLTVHAERLTSLPAIAVTHVDRVKVCQPGEGTNNSYRK
jgi:hypothetical protein